MCGIAGLHYFSPLMGKPPFEATELIIKRMNEAQIHRGPDDEGLWIAPDGRIALGHRRLAIIDLSPAGHQPMSNEDGTIWITYNGEIYNFQSLRGELESRGHIFRSQSDTEVVLHAFEEWGTDAFRRFRGMFAFALWDGRFKRLYLVKDRFGIKPLYYYLDEGKIAFASEVRALAKSGLFNPEKNHNALISFLLLGSVPIPQTTISQVQGLLPGHYLVAEGVEIRIEQYYNLWNDGAHNSLGYRPGAFRDLLTEAIDLHLISDAPIGVFLSGGIDSSALVALGATARKSQLTTLSIIFKESQYSEQKYQRLMAERYHTDHHELTVTQELFQEELPRVLKAMDQPSIDGVNTYFVSLMAKRAGLKAVLSGAGSDEIFCGYPHFHKARFLTWLSILGPLVRAFNGAARHLPGKWRKLSFLGLGGYLGAYLAVRGLFTPEEVAKLTGDTLTHVQSVAQSLCPPAPNSPPIDRLSRWEIAFYLQNQLLKDADCMSMAHSVETRVPFLDPFLVSAILGSPPDGRINRNTPKPMLVKALGELLPTEVVYRPKMTFTFPFAEWLKLRSELHPDHGRLSMVMFNATWQDFLAGRFHWTRPWALLVARDLVSQ